METETKKMETDAMPGTPQRLAEELYWKYSEFENLSVDEVKSACCIALSLAMESADTAMRLFYGDARYFIKNRGKGV